MALQLERKSRIELTRSMHAWKIGLAEERAKELQKQETEIDIEIRLMHGTCRVAASYAKANAIQKMNVIHAFRRGIAEKKP